VSQTAESARDWINSTHPSTEQLQNAAQAIQRKLNVHPSLEQADRNNLAAALQLVLGEIESQQYAQNDTSNTLTSTGAKPLDTSPLTTSAPDTATNTLDATPLGTIADPSIRHLEGLEKRAAFERLKAQIQ